MRSGGQNANDRRAQTVSEREGNNLLTLIRRLFQRRPKHKPLPPGEYVACVTKVAVVEDTGHLRLELAVPGLEDRKFHVYLSPNTYEGA